MLVAASLLIVNPKAATFLHVALNPQVTALAETAACSAGLNPLYCCLTIVFLGAVFTIPWIHLVAYVCDVDYERLKGKINARLTDSLTDWFAVSNFVLPFLRPSGSFGDICSAN